MVTPPTRRHVPPCGRGPSTVPSNHHSDHHHPVAPTRSARHGSRSGSAGTAFSTEERNARGLEEFYRPERPVAPTLPSVRIITDSVLYIENTRARLLSAHFTVRSNHAARTQLSIRVWRAGVARGLPLGEPSASQVDPGARPRSHRLPYSGAQCLVAVAVVVNTAMCRLPAAK